MITDPNPDAVFLLPDARLRRAKRAYTTRHVPPVALHALDARPVEPPQAGDLLLARVTRLGKHQSIEQVDSRRSALFVGDEILLAYGARYAPDQFEAEVPASLAPCHLAAGGGVAGLVTRRHGAVSAPTEIEPLGLVLNAHGRRVRLADHALPARAGHGPRPLTIASVGSSMNAGKTTSAAYLVKGLCRAGLRVGAAKITGTGSGNDPGLLRDAGACEVLDFTDCGCASTSGLDLEALLGILTTVQCEMAVRHVPVLVMEVADGLLQRETAMLLQSPLFAQRVDACLFSSGEAMGAAAGLRWLHERGLPVLALAGTLTRSPLAQAEAEAATGLRALTLAELSDADQARALLQRATELSVGSVAA